VPTQPKPPPQREVEELLLGLFGWLRANELTSAAVPARAKREILGALKARALKGPAAAVGAGFLVALDTWLNLSSPELRRRAASSQSAGVASFLHAEADEEQRGEAIGLLRALAPDRLRALIETIAAADAERLTRHGASAEKRAALRRRWMAAVELLCDSAEVLESKLRAPRGVPFPRTLKEWNEFEQALIARLRANGFSYREITRLTRPTAMAAAKAAESAPRARAERERIRGAARRARARKR
jgi:hypothetical protein